MSLTGTDLTERGIARRIMSKAGFHQNSTQEWSRKREAWLRSPQGKEMLRELQDFIDDWAKRFALETRPACEFCPSPATHIAAQSPDEGVTVIWARVCDTHVLHWNEHSDWDAPIYKLVSVPST